MSTIPDWVPSVDHLEVKISINSQAGGQGSHRAWPCLSLSVVNLKAACGAPAPSRCTKKQMAIRVVVPAGANRSDRQM